MRVQACLSAADDDTLQTRAERISRCGMAPMFVATPEGKLSTAPGLCRDRMCPTCQQRRARSTAAKVSALTATMDSPRFMTFTLRHAERPLFLTIAALSASFRVLRATKEWRRHVEGGVYAVEITRNAETGLWHAHVHVICSGTFWAQADMSRVWLRVTGDSKIVDVRAVHSRSAAANYIAKYVAKPSDAAHWPPAAVCEYADAMHGKRLIHTFGKSYAVEVDDESPDVQKRVVEPLCTANHVLHAARKGDAYGLLARELISRAGGFAAKLVDPCNTPKTSVPVPLQDWEWVRLITCLRELGSRATRDECPQYTHWDLLAKRELAAARRQLTLWTTPPA